MLSDNQEEILSPFKPLHYLRFIHWFFTIDEKSLFQSKRIDLDKRFTKFISFLISLLLWSSILFMTIFIDIFVIPSSLRQKPKDPVFPYMNHMASNESSTTTTSSSISNATLEINESSSILIDTILLRKGHPSFHPWVFLTNILLCFIGFIFSTIWNKPLRGFLNLFVSFIISSILMTRIFYWSDEKTSFIFIIVRFFELMLILSIGIKTSKFLPNILHFMPPLFSSFMAMIISFSMLSNEEQLIMNVSILGPLFFCFIGVISSPLLLYRNINSNNMKVRILSILFAFISPFFVSVLFNWWYYFAFLNQISVPISSYKNILVIYFSGLSFGIMNMFHQKIVSKLNEKILFILLIIFYVISYGFLILQLKAKIY